MLDSDNLSNSSYDGDYEESAAELIDLKYKCLRCSDTFNNYTLVFSHMTDSHDLNVPILMNKLRIKTEYEWIKLINFIRASDNFNNDILFDRNWEDEKYLIPYLEDDNLLFLDIIDIFGINQNEMETDQNESKRNILISLQERHEKLMELLSTTSSEDNEKRVIKAEDDDYFSGYSHYQIHDTMIKDNIRTESYRRFIEEEGRHFFNGKVVLDVGCGTGILSLFAARAGAKHVYGVDCADIIFNAMSIVKKNGFDEKITLIHGKLEDIELPVKQVDVIISEWMGYMLLYESMVESVLYAGNKYLNANEGHLFPNNHSLIISGATMSEYRTKNLDCWSNICGFDMSCIKSGVFREVIVTVVPSTEIMTNPVVLRHYDLKKEMKKSADERHKIQSVSEKFVLKSTKKDLLGGLVLYFDTDFHENTVSFSTGPHAPETHWQQSVLLLEEPITMEAGSELSGEINIRRHKNGRRGLKVHLKIGDKPSQSFDFC